MLRIKNTLRVIVLSFIVATTIQAKERVVIVGSGLSGLSTAYQLLKTKGDDVSIEIYEGLARVGGRTFSVPVGDGYVEAGATFINREHTELLNIAKKLGLKIMQLPGKENRQFSYIFEGKLYSEEQIFEKLEPFFKQIEADRKMLESNEFFSRRLEQLSVDDYLKNVLMPKVKARDEDRKLLHSILSTVLADETGAPTDQLNAHHLFEQVEIDLLGKHFDPYGDSDEALKIDGGNQQISLKLKEYLEKKGVKFHFEHKLEQLDVLEDGKVVLQINGKKIVADEAVVTAPTHALLDHVKMDSSVRKLLEARSSKRPLGANTKYVLTFNRDFWSQYQFPTRFMGSFYQLWNSSEGGAMTFTIYMNSNAYRIMKESNLTWDDMVEKVVSEANEFMPEFRKEIVNISETVDWKVHPFFGGSYSGGLARGNWDAATMPLKNRVGNLVFAGEQWNNEFPGFMEGAFRSGQDAAKVLSRSLQLKKVPCHKLMESVLMPAM